MKIAVFLIEEEHGQLFEGEHLDYDIDEMGYLYLFTKTGPQKKGKTMLAIYNHWDYIAFGDDVIVEEEVKH